MIEQQNEAQSERSKNAVICAAVKNLHREMQQENRGLQECESVRYSDVQRCARSRRAGRNGQPTQIYTIPYPIFIQGVSLAEDKKEDAKKDISQRRAIVDAVIKEQLGRKNLELQRRDLTWDQRIAELSNPDVIRQITNEVIEEIQWQDEYFRKSVPSDTLFEKVKERVKKQISKMITLYKRYEQEEELVERSLLEIEKRKERDIERIEISGGSRLYIDEEKKKIKDFYNNIKKRKREIEAETKQRKIERRLEETEAELKKSLRKKKEREEKKKEREEERLEKYRKSKLRRKLVRHIILQGRIPRAKGWFYTHIEQLIKNLIFVVIGMMISAMLGSVWFLIAFLFLAGYFAIPKKKSPVDKVIEDVKKEFQPNIEKDTKLLNETKNESEREKIQSQLNNYYHLMGKEIEARVGSIWKGVVFGGGLTLAKISMKFFAFMLFTFAFITSNLPLAKPIGLLVAFIFYFTIKEGD